MKLYLSLIVTIIIYFNRPLQAQIDIFPYSESFDSTAAPSFPEGWSENEFIVNTSLPHSSPNCISATGNTLSKSVESPVFDFTNRFPDKLIYWERRSPTAALFRLEICASIDGTNYDIYLHTYDTISSTSGFVQRVVDISNASLQQKQNVRFQWKLLKGDKNDSVNTKGVLRIDDLMLTVMTRYDLGVTTTAIPAANAFLEDSIILSATVRNYGILGVSDYSLRCFLDIDNNGHADPDEQFFVLNGQALNSNDSINYIIPVKPLNAGIHRFITVIDCPQDENTENDSDYTIINIGSNSRSLLINEIMFDPLDGQNEWIELFNRSSDTVNLIKWSISDKINSFEISSADKFLFPGKFTVIAAESSIYKIFPNLLTDSKISICIMNRTGGLSLNNDADAVVLKDLTDRTIDSVEYSARWHHPDIIDTRGRSLERINPDIDSNDPRNWSTCIFLSGGTPGCPNSIFNTGITNNTKISISPNPFSPDGDGFEDFCLVHYYLPIQISIVNVRIYDIKGRLVRVLANCEPVGSKGDIVWDGLDNNKQRVRIGVYIVYLEAVDRTDNSVLTAKTVAVVATRL